MNIKQISLFLENKPGQIAEITKLLFDGNIDLKAINVAETADYGILRIIADDAEKALDILISNGFITTITPVYAIGVSNKPGGLHDLLELLNNEKINVEYMYSIFGNIRNHAYMIMKVDDADKMEKIIADKKLRSVSITDFVLN